MNTTTTMPPEAPLEESRLNGPGNQLRQARLDLKLAPEDVAHILHLSPKQIVALESDDYAKLAGPTYVRGYLRGYAQLLGLSSEPIVEAYNKLVAAKKPVDLGKLTPKPELRSDHQLIKFATVGVVAIVLGLSAVWWQEQEPATPPVRDSVPPSATTNEPAGTEESTTSEAPPTATATPEATKNVPASKSPTPTMDRPSAATPALSAGPRGRLVLQTTADTWVDVRDANGTRLYYDTIQAGRSVALEGVTPLAVFLGNAEGVRVEYNGQVYDASRHRRGEIARFTLGETARTP